MLRIRPREVPRSKIKSHIQSDFTRPRRVSTTEVRPENHEQTLLRSPLDPHARVLGRRADAARRGGGDPRPEALCDDARADAADDEARADARRQADARAARAVAAAGGRARRLR